MVRLVCLGQRCLQPREHEVWPIASDLIDQPQPHVMRCLSCGTETRLGVTPGWIARHVAEYQTIAA
jgi:hypothetical protein